MLPDASQYLDEPTSAKELESYLFELKYGRKTVPTKVDPRYVERVIRERVDRSQSERCFAKARRLVDYYDLRGVLDHFRKMLNRRERDAREHRQSCRCVSILADAAEPADERLIDDYFEYLSKHPFAADNWDALLETLETLGPEVKWQTLAKRLGEAMKATEARAKTDPEADDQYQRLDQYLNNDLPRVLEANQFRYRILALPDAGARIVELCAAYCGWDADGSDELDWWSARWIRREWPAHRDLVLAALLKIVREVDASKIPESERTFPKVRALRAIQFFGVLISPEESRYVVNAATQIDVLYRER